MTPAGSGYGTGDGASRASTEEGTTVKFILIVALVIIAAFVLFKYVLPGMRRR